MQDKKTQKKKGQNKNSKDNSNNEDIVFDEEGVVNKSELKKIRDKLKQCIKEKQSNLEGWQRTRADFVNIKKENEKSRIELKKYANEQLILDILPVLDSFDMASANKKAWESVDKNWRDGIMYIQSQLLSTLEQNGVIKIDAINKEFDTNLHNSIEVVQTDKKESYNTVAEVLQNGYMLNGKVIRPAKVKVFMGFSKK